jgi:peptidoglycan-associated lipoprotein
MRWTKVAAAVGTMGFTLAGCAHQQQAKVEQAPAPVAVAVAQPEKSPVPEVQPPSQESQDLEALLRGTLIHFEYNEDLLTSESRDRLQKLAVVIRQRRDASIKISGNCDERGTEEYNIALGQRRAQVARTYLVGLGVDGRHIDTVSYSMR